MKKILCIVGTRPNLIKLNCLYKNLIKYFNTKIIHTGQHMSFNMNTIFFKQLNIPKPDYFLGCNTKLIPAGSLQDELYNNFNRSKIKFYIKELLSNNNGQISLIIDKLRPIFEEERPDLVMVFGDVTSTLASSLIAFDMHIPIAHIESGLRSSDYNMPEEINRILVDYMSTYYFISEPSGINNLLNEGYNEHLYIVGNTMIDSLYSVYNYIKKPIYKNYILITLHRPSNVDNNQYLIKILKELEKLSNKYNIIFPIHPRTKNNINIHKYKYITFIDPQDYISFISLIKYSIFIITDSGGVQEESTHLGKMCFTLRKNTERPLTLIKNGGTNSLIDSINDIDLKNKNVSKLINNLWDGNASIRISKLLVSLLQ
tara:strand:+ start:443 stop:1558 length:1116 start_codon:yes stop_codon:yes gene_type:complete